MKTNLYPNQKGFSLVELMVGLTIGLFVLLGVLLAYSQWDGLVRTSSGKTDAQMTATVAAFRLESDLSSAGLGLGSAPAFGIPDNPDGGLGCVVAAVDSARSPTNFTFPLIPVEIIQGVGGAPDTINVLFGAADTRTLHIRFTGTAGSQTQVKTRGGMVAGDRVILVSEPPVSGTRTCAMVEVTSDLAFTPGTIAHVSAGSYTDFRTGSSVTPTMNPAGGPVLSPTRGVAYNLGPTPQYNTWAITAPPAPPSLTVNRLFTLTAAGTNVPETVAEDVVNLQAMYGIDALVFANRDGVVDAWVDAAPADLTRVIAIKYAILSRSRQYERPISLSPLTWATSMVPTWNNNDASPPIPFVMTDVSGPNMGVSNSGAPDATNWQGYRYTVREGIIPLRNMLWGQRP